MTLAQLATKAAIARIAAETQQRANHPDARRVRLDMVSLDDYRIHTQRRNAAMLETLPSTVGFYEAGVSGQAIQSDIEFHLAEVL